MADMIEGGSPRITILLTDMAPKSIDPQEWPILVQTPVDSAPAQHLVVRTRDKRALVYGHKGAGMDISGAGLYGGQLIVYNGEHDMIAEAIFKVGTALGFDRKQLWVLVQSLPADQL